MPGIGIGGRPCCCAADTMPSVGWGSTGLFGTGPPWFGKPEGVPCGGMPCGCCCIIWPPMIGGAMPATIVFCIGELWTKFPPCGARPFCCCCGGCCGCCCCIIGLAPPANGLCCAIIVLACGDCA